MLLMRTTTTNALTSGSVPGVGGGGGSGGRGTVHVNAFRLLRSSSAQNSPHQQSNTAFINSIAQPNPAVTNPTTQQVPSQPNATLSIPEHNL